MRACMIFVLLAAVAAGADKKPTPGLARNGNLELSGSVFIDRESIKQVLGEEIGEGYIVVQLKATPKTEEPVRLTPDDFTLVSRKDGAKSQALSPGQIAGRGALVVKSSGEHLSSPGVRLPPQLKVEAKDTAENAPLMTALTAKMFPDSDTKTPTEGLLYFPIEGKLKPKDVSLIYNGQAGKMVMDFK